MIRICLFLFFLPFIVNTQVILQIDSNFVGNVPDTVSIGEFLEFTVTVRNDGVSDFDGEMLIAFRNEDQSLLTPNDTVSCGQALLMAGESEEFTFLKPVTESSFRIGNDVVVIWPVPVGLPPGDEHIFDVVVLGSNSIEEKIGFEALEIFPNPSLNWVNFESMKEVKEVRIFDSSGRQVYLGKETSIYVGDYSKGIYFIRMTDSQRTIYSNRIVIR